MRALAARRPARLLPPRRLLAADGHAARPQPPRGAVELRRGSVAHMASVTPAAATSTGFWRGRRVLVTGHTGFKGAWLALWLQSLGAEVTGLSRRRADRAVAVRAGARGRAGTASVDGDVRDAERSRAAFADAPARGRLPHGRAVARAALVRRSARDLRDERHGHGQRARGRARQVDDVRVVVNVTSDKCYENRERERGYREDEPMGGHDPYSSSKGCAELVADAFRRSLLRLDPDGAAPRLGARRQRDRRRRLGRGSPRSRTSCAPRSPATPLRVRNPDAVRPWQHVLNPLSGYLVLAQALWESAEHATALELRPGRRRRAAGRLARRAARRAVAGGPAAGSSTTDPQPHEARYLRARLVEGPRRGSAGARLWASTRRSRRIVDVVPGAARRGARHARSHAGADRSLPTPPSTVAAMTRRPRCRFCGAAARARLRRPRHVAAGELLPARRAAPTAMEPFYPLRALVCGECFLVQLEEFETPEQIFSRLRVLLVVLDELARAQRAATPSR